MELNIAIHGRKNRVILTHANILAGIECGATLAHDDIAGNDNFAAVFFHAEATTS